jgi:transposase
LRANAAGDSAAAREVARLTRENARLTKQLTQTEAALEIMGKLHGLLESISERPGTPPRPSKP